jgi:hypothetical protein
MILPYIACDMQNMQKNMHYMQNMQTSLAFSICRICTAHFADDFRYAAELHFELARLRTRSHLSLSACHFETNLSDSCVIHARLRTRKHRYKSGGGVTAAMDENDASVSEAAAAGALRPRSSSPGAESELAAYTGDGPDPVRTRILLAARGKLSSNLIICWAAGVSVRGLGPYRFSTGILSSFLPALHFSPPRRL